MPTLDTILVLALVAAVLTWAGLALHVLAVQHHRARAHAAVARATAVLASEGVRHLTVLERLERVRPFLEEASREMIMRAAADEETPAENFDVWAEYLAAKWGFAVLEQDAASHASARDKWRRMTALRILGHLDQTLGLGLLARAVDEADEDIALVALAQLGRSNDPAAVTILIDALKRQLYPAAHIAAQLDRSPQHLADRLRPLLDDADPVVRLWSATLLGRYPDVPGLERALAALAADADPRVRKAAMQSLGLIGDELATTTALRLLTDPAPFVRATAARALGMLDRPEHARDVTALLGDKDWWVRFAAKECLEMMGEEVWPVLVRLLDSPDRFVRNGAAEVFQNLGLLDSFILMEAASDEPAAAKIDMLRRITVAGGVRLTDSLVERAGAAMGLRVRQLLTTIGLEHVEAA
jgi:HEAT repeat protein